jgi:hypothetical protein
MPEVNKQWVAEQLEAAKVKVGSGKAILKLLEVWSELPELSEKMTDEVLSVFSLVAKGHTLAQEESADDYIWIALQPGHVVVGDVVRVKADAFSGAPGPIHNGRLGKVVGIRYGEVYVNMTDNKLPKLEGQNYSPYKLEKRVRKAQ